MMDRAQRLGEENIAPLLLKFAAPAIVGLLAQALYFFIDRVFVSRALDTPWAVAGMTVAFPFMLILMALGMLVGFGAAALISIRLGEKRKPDAEHVLGNATMLLLAAAVLSTALGLLWLVPLLRFFGATDNNLPFARDYAVVIVLGSVFQIVGFGLNNMIRAEGNPKIAMLTMLISVLLNVVLAPIFLFVFHWGMRGAALATVAAQAVSAAWVLGYFLSGRSLLRLRARNLRLQWPVCGRLLAIGSAPFALQVANSLVHSVINNQLRVQGGDLAIAAWGVIYGVFMLIFMPVFGVNQGAQPIIGYNYGAERFDRVKKTLQTAVLAATGIAVCGFAVTMLFPAQVLWLFSGQRKSLADMAELGTHAMRLCTLMLPLVGFQIVSAGYFQAVGKPAQAMFLTLSRQVLLLIPAVWILPRFFHLDGVWMSLPAADLGSSVLTGVWLLLELRHLQRRHLSTAAPAWAPAVTPEI
jgi:putative MATE family efflux protein